MYTAVLGRVNHDRAFRAETATALMRLLAVNFVIHGLLAPGVSGTTRPDAQAKGLGEYLRSRLVPVPADLI